MSAVFDNSSTISKNVFMDTSLKPSTNKFKLFDLLCSRDFSCKF